MSRSRLDCFTKVKSQPHHKRTQITLARNANRSKQITLDRIPEAASKEPSKPSKQITITQIEATTGENELALKFAFKLYPSKAAFSKVHSDLWFNSQLINSVVIRIPQGPLATDECEYGCVLNMNGIPADVYAVKVEMYEQWQTGEKLCQTTKEVIVDYTPKTRQSRYIRIPTVKSIAGADFAVASDSQRRALDEIVESQKKELLNKRDNW